MPGAPAREDVVMRVRIGCSDGRRGDADQWHGRAAGQDRHGHTRRSCGSCCNTGENCRPDGNGSGVPCCGSGEQRDDRGGLRRLPAAPARGPDGSGSGASCLGGCESVGYPDGQASGRIDSVATRAFWRMPPLTLPPLTVPSVGRPMSPDRLSNVHLLSYPGDRGLGGRDCGSSQEPGGHAGPDDLGDLPGMLGHGRRRLNRRHPCPRVASGPGDCDDPPGSHIHHEGQAAWPRSRCRRDDRRRHFGDDVSLGRVQLDSGGAGNSLERGEPVGEVLPFLLGFRCPLCQSIDGP